MVVFFLFQKESRCIDFTQYIGIDLVNPHVKIQFEINSQLPDRSVSVHGYDILVNPHVKIQFEINSQLQDSWQAFSMSTCESSRKNTI